MSFHSKSSGAGAPPGASEVRLYYCDVPIFRSMFSSVLKVKIKCIFFEILQVCVHNLVTEDSLVSRSSEFEAAIQNGERSLLRILCDKKSQESEYVFSP